MCESMIKSWETKTDTEIDLTKKLVVVTVDTSDCSNVGNITRFVYLVDADVVAVGGTFISQDIESFDCIVKVNEFLESPFKNGQIAEDSGFSIIRRKDKIAFDQHGRINIGKTFGTRRTFVKELGTWVITTIASESTMCRLMYIESGEGEFAKEMVEMILHDNRDGGSKLVEKFAGQDSPK